MAVKIVQTPCHAHEGHGQVCGPRVKATHHCWSSSEAANQRPAALVVLQLLVWHPLPYILLDFVVQV